MKKIALFDPYLYKFTGDMVEWWKGHGYEVKTDRYYDPKLVEWADVIWFDTCDNNLLSATNPGQALRDEGKATGVEWDLHNYDLSQKKIIVRPIDIEVWQGHHAQDRMWDIVDDCIFIAPHIRDIMMADSRPQGHKMRIHTIPCGVDLSRWNFDNRQPGFNIAVVAERWVSKGVDYVIQIALKLKDIDPRYQIYWLGKNNDYHWERDYLEDMIRRHELPIILVEDFVENLDAWLEDKNYLLSASKKEAFGYNIAEAMAKGIKPVIHEFFGFEPIWGDSPWTWASIDEAVNLITEDKYSSEEYLSFLYKQGFTLEQMMERFEAIING